MQSRKAGHIWPSMHIDVRLLTGKSPQKKKKKKKNTNVAEPFRPTLAQWPPSRSFPPTTRARPIYGGLRKRLRRITSQSPQTRQGPRFAFFSADRESYGPCRCPVYEEIRLIAQDLFLFLFLFILLILPFLHRRLLPFSLLSVKLGIPRDSCHSLTSSYEANRELLGSLSHKVPISDPRIFRIVRVSGSTFLCLV
ncbi:hypothetical protein CGRA01v4_08187 [Colletotrichum graminicola]|nr:hypothetical protein CGRA01v4_08187 [Colletotrichum graminicola]